VSHRCLLRFFETESHYVAGAGLEPSIFLTRPPNAEVTGICHYTGLFFVFLCFGSKSDSVHFRQVHL
jgi:hypothetical protein